MGVFGVLSSVWRRLAGGGGHAAGDHHQGGADDPVVEQVALLHHRHDRARLLAGVDLAGSYVYRRQRAQAADGASDWFHVFELTRGHLALGAESSHAEGRLLVETVRSAADGSLTGVAGDSLVLRAREAFVGLSTCGRRRPAEPNLDLAPCLRTVRGRASLGVVPTPLLAELDGTAMMGPLSRSTGERESWLSPSDAGVSARLDFGAAAHVTGGVFNGEGYGQRELNRGKNGEVVARFAPRTKPDAPEVLAVIEAELKK